MKYIDSNIIIRLITNDEPELAQQAVSWLESTELLEFTILDAVITEVCFVLEFNPNYQLPRSLIYDGLYTIFDTTGANRGAHTDGALKLYLKYPKLDYVDCLLHAFADGKRNSIVTFDKELINKLR